MPQCAIPCDLSRHPQRVPISTPPKTADSVRRGLSTWGTLEFDELGARVYARDAFDRGASAMGIDPPNNGPQRDTYEFPRERAPSPPLAPLCPAQRAPPRRPPAAGGFSGKRALFWAQGPADNVPPLAFPRACLCPGPVPWLRCPPPLFNGSSSAVSAVSRSWLSSRSRSTTTDGRLPLRQQAPRLGCSGAMPSDRDDKGDDKDLDGGYHENEGTRGERAK